MRTTTSEKIGKNGGKAYVKRKGKPIRRSA